MNNYELLSVVNSEWAEGDIAKAERMLTGELEKVDGRVVNIKKIGNRRLAYPIKGQKEGIYLVLYFTAPPAAVSALRANLKLNPGILRILIIKIKESPTLELEPPPPSKEEKELVPLEEPEEAEKAVSEETEENPEKVETADQQDTGEKQEEEISDETLVNDETRIKNDEQMTKPE